ncbi:uncharacterized protein PG986_002128 [Apiospora aurea]|uniref:Uncharacterized protein n=1 Tax=Apiospora aurea TaxID=335848 RepID=A0ABR1QYR9_9PEZI
MAGFNKKKKNGKKGTKHATNKKPTKESVEDDNAKTNAPSAAATAAEAGATLEAATAAAASPPSDEHTQEEQDPNKPALKLSTAKKALRRSVKQILATLAADAATPDPVLALQYPPTLLELHAQHLALIADQVRVLEALAGAQTTNANKDPDAYLGFVYLTSQVERAQLEHAALQRRIRRYRLSLGGPAAPAT